MWHRPLLFSQTPAYVRRSSWKIIKIRVPRLTRRWSLLIHTRRYFLIAPTERGGQKSSWPSPNDKRMRVPGAPHNTIRHNDFHFCFVGYSRRHSAALTIVGRPARSVPTLIWLALINSYSFVLLLSDWVINPKWWTATMLNLNSVLLFNKFEVVLKFKK